MTLYRVEVTRSGAHVFYVDADSHGAAVDDATALADECEDFAWDTDDVTVGESAQQPKGYELVWTGGDAGQYIRYRDFAP